MSVQHPDELLAAFALDALTDEESESVRSHLVDCTVCRQEVARYRIVTEVLPLSISDGPVPPLDLRDRILRVAEHTEQIRVMPSLALVPNRPQTRRGTGLYGWLVAAALLLVVLGFGAETLSLNREIQALSAPSIQQGELIATASAPGADGRYALDRNRDVIINVVNLPPPTTGEIYEAWVIDAGGPRAAGIFVTSPDGQGTVALTHPATPGSTIAITNEPTPGLQAPSGKVLLKATVS